jgi:hypothetical protein
MYTYNGQGDAEKVLLLCMCESEACVLCVRSTNSICPDARKKSVSILIRFGAAVLPAPIMYSVVFTTWATSKPVKTCCC